MKWGEYKHWGEIRLWDLATHQPRARFPAHAGLVRLLTYSSDAKLLATADVNGEVKLWDMTGF